MNAIMVCVDYADLLAITLPYNRHHFDRVVVVTSMADLKSSHVALDNGAQVFATDSFYANGAVFNKWKALEEGLDFMGREGWICNMDADVLWPKEIKLCGCGCHSTPGMMHFGACCKPECGLKRGNLYSPLRRMCENIRPFTQGIIPENEWTHFTVHRNIAEWAGYSQIFHASDPVLGDPPWHQIDWKHAGGADSFFQEKWPAEKKIRPPFEVLHLGPAGKNWYGRATPYLDGSIPRESAEKLESINQIWRNRQGKSGEARFEGEKIVK